MKIFRKHKYPLKQRLKWKYNAWCNFWMFLFLCLLGPLGLILFLMDYDNIFYEEGPADRNDTV